MLTAAFSPSLGIQPDNKIVFAIAAVAFNAGEVGQFDLAMSDAGTLTDIIGKSDSMFARLIKPTAGGIVCGIMGVWLQNVAAGQRGRVLLWGDVEAQLIKASGNIARGDQLIANTDGRLTPDHSAGDRILAIALEPLTAPATATEARVLFNGVHGLGVFTS